MRQTDASLIFDGECSSGGRTHLFIRLDHNHVRLHAVHLHIVLGLRANTRAATVAGSFSGSLLPRLRKELSVRPQIEVSRDEVKDDCSRYADQQHCTRTCLW